MIYAKRLYLPEGAEDGHRILVDRYWPRGVAKNQLKYDRWMPELAPSHNLRKWFKVHTQHWDEFLLRYQQELNEQKNLLQEIKILEAEHGSVTLLFGARNSVQNHAVALLHYLNNL